MNKEFIPYEQALDLKELGFNEECFAIHSFVDGELNFMYVNSFHSNDDVNELSAAAPTFSQAFRWFREKHRLQPSVNSFCFEEYSFIIMDNRNEILYPIQYKLLDDGKKNPWEFDTYEEAELHCLKKLIEIVKHKNNYGN